MDANGAELAGVTAVVLIWNSGELGIRTLRSLEGAFADGMRMVMIDNGSVDGSFEAMREFVDEWAFAGSVDLVRSEENLGFCGGVNLGTSIALSTEPAPDYIWMLNPDAEVSPDTAIELVAVLRDSGAGIVSPAGILTSLDVPTAWPRVFWTTPKSRTMPVPPQVRWWLGARYDGSCAIFTAPLVQRLIASDGQFLDTRLFMDWDEWECTLRAVKFGAVVAYSRDAENRHGASGRTLGKTRMAASRQYYQSRNSIVVARRNMPCHHFWLALPMHIGRDLSWFARLRVRGVHPNERAYIQGAWDGIRGRSGVWKHHPPSPAAKR